MKFIVWDDSYKLGIPLIDAQHERLFEVINTYHDSTISVDEAFAALISYIEFHFKTEEYYFEKFNYEFTREHKEGHRYYQDNIIKLQEEYLKNRFDKNIRIKIEEFVRDWISNHIKNKDVLYKNCFIEHGMKNIQTPSLSFESKY